MRYDQHDELEQCLTAMRLKCQKAKWQWDTGLLWGVKILLACYVECGVRGVFYHKYNGC